MDQLAARQRPTPGPLPTTPLELLEVRPRPGPGVRGRRRWSRRISHALRSKRGRRVLIGLASVTVLLVGLLVEGFLFSPAPSIGAPDSALDGGGSAPSESPTPLHAKSKADKHTGAPGPVSNPVAALRQQFPDNPLNHLRADGLHHVTITATSRQPIALVGFLVPTGFGPSYGTVKPHSTRWSVSEQAIGPGYLAAIFVQAGRDGTPITCQVSVDGTVTDTETTAGGYGRAICLG